MKPTIKSLLMLSLLAGSLPAMQANAAAAEPNCGGTTAFQLGNPIIEIGSQQVKVAHAPYAQADALMVPVRELAQGLNAATAWKDGVLKLTKGSTVVTIKGNRMQADGKAVTLAVPIRNFDGKVYVPLRAAADALKAELTWNPKTKTASVHDTAACEKPVAATYTFEKDAQGWSGGFADLPVQHEDADYQLAFKWSSLPPVGGQQLKGLMLQGMNRSDDLFMYAVRKLDAKDGLKPNTSYKVKLSFRMATNEASSSVGIGGSPGQSVFIKAGVVNVEPKPVETDGTYRMNFDKGNQSTDGKDLKLVGDAAKPDASLDGYQLKPMQLDAAVKTGANGEAYLVIGSDSGYEGLSTLYFTDIHAEFTPQP